MKCDQHIFFFGNATQTFSSTGNATRHFSLKEMRPKHFLLKETGSLDEDQSRASFLGRKIVRHGDSISLHSFDDYLQPAQAIERFKSLTQIEIIPVAGAKHLWVGEPAVYTVLSEITKIIAQERLPLPTEI
jgi:hypothetical protein